MGFNRGYIGSSMSVRAAEAYENGEKPWSKWTKQVIVSEISRIAQDVSREGLDQLKQVKVNELRRLFLTYSSWHHTSKFYNMTDFYSIDEDKVRIWCEYFSEADAQQRERIEQALHDYRELHEERTVLYNLLELADLDEDGLKELLTDDDYIEGCEEYLAWYEGHGRELVEALNTSRSVKEFAHTSGLSPKAPMVHAHGVQIEYVNERVEFVLPPARWYSNSYSMSTVADMAWAAEEIDTDAIKRGDKVAVFKKDLARLKAKAQQAVTERLANEQRYSEVCAQREALEKQWGQDLFLFHNDACSILDFFNRLDRLSTKTSKDAEEKQPAPDITRVKIRIRYLEAVSDFSNRRRMKFEQVVVEDTPNVRKDGRIYSVKSRRLTSKNLEVAYFYKPPKARKFREISRDYLEELGYKFAY